MVIFGFVAEDTIEPKRDHKNVRIDEQLFAQIGHDDMEALATLYRLTERTLYAYILSIMRNHEETLDVMQDTYLKIRAAAHLYKPMGKPLAWMFVIARNLSYSKLRGKSNSSIIGTEKLENNLKYAYVSDPEDRMVLEAALEILSEEERQIVLLHAVAGYKHKEIAQSMAVPLSTALSRYHRALKKLRDHLQGGRDSNEE